MTFEMVGANPASGGGLFLVGLDYTRVE